MFGSHGLYQGDNFFGIVSKGRLYFKTDDTSREKFIEAGMSHFQPNAKPRLTSYYGVPAEGLEHQNHLAEWAKQTIACQSNKKASRRR